MGSKLTGLIAATFSPMNADGSINTVIIPEISDYLVSHCIDGLYVCGSTGEGALLSVEERKQIASAYIESIDKRIPVVVHVGHDSIVEAQTLAKHAESIGADAIASVGPSYFKPTCIESLIEYLAKIAEGAPNTDFYYYYVPILNGSSFDMTEFLEKAPSKIPTLKGIKYTALTVFEFQQLREVYGDRFQIFFGCDEMLTSGMAAGADSAIGSTYNYAGKLYREIMNAFNKGDIKTAQELQYKSVQMVRVSLKYGGHSARKAMMKLAGLDCGPPRLPLLPVKESDMAGIKSDLEAIDFMKWM